MDATLNPKWHDHCYRTEIPRDYYDGRDAEGHRYYLVLRIYDWDYNGGHDVMGQVYIPLQDMTSYGTEGWYPVGLSVILSFCLFSLDTLSRAPIACRCFFCLPVLSRALLCVGSFAGDSSLTERICRFRPIRRSRNQAAEGTDGRDTSG